jgi:glucose-6-phosphate isomerase
MDGVFSAIGDALAQTLVIVISKSGKTIETRNGMAEARNIFRKNGLNFAGHAVGITRPGSLLDKARLEEGWLAGFPMWDWVGGRTSVLSAVGLLPLALQGGNIALLLEGARKCDEITRQTQTFKNPAALLALMWYAVTGGQGGK